MRYYIIAGEASGELHGSNLMTELYREDPEAVIRFRGGEKMNEVWKKFDGKSGGMAADYREGAVMGLGEILSKAGKLLGSFASCKKDIEDFAPDAVILIDYPGFNLRIAEWAHNKGYRTLYYIAPKVWATREWRVKSIKKFIDRLFLILPFEKEFFSSRGVSYVYCGNPLVDQVAKTRAVMASREDFLKSIGIDSDKRIIAMLAGSRKGEISTMIPPYCDTVRLLRKDSRYDGYEFILAGAPGITPDVYKAAGLDESLIKLVSGKTGELLNYGDAAIINSGTASLEAVLYDIPQVVGYKFPLYLTSVIATRMLKTKWFSLGNLCIDREAFRELRQDECNAAGYSAELERLLWDKDYRGRMLEDYREIRERLGGTGASSTAARSMVDFLKIR